MLEVTGTTYPATPYGKISDTITLGKVEGRKVAFLPRHGTGHRLAPHMINYKANIWALQQLGVNRIIAPSAVGSLRTDIKPGHFAVPSQFIDNTRGRAGSFTEEGRAIHISVADPFCPELSRCVLNEPCSTTVHKDCTYICIEGPRFSTKAESALYQSFGADIIGMTLVPECQLAREARICYVSISMVTDYDVWAGNPVTAKEVAKVMSGNIGALKRMLPHMIKTIPYGRRCSCGKAMDDAVL